MTRELERRYTRYGRVAHLLDPLEYSERTGTAAVLCGLWEWYVHSWLGTGSQAEYERAASLPVCKNCQARR